MVFRRKTLETELARGCGSESHIQVPDVGPQVFHVEQHAFSDENDLRVRQRWVLSHQPMERGQRRCEPIQGRAWTQFHVEHMAFVTHGLPRYSAAPGCADAEGMGDDREAKWRYRRRVLFSG